MSVGVDDFMSVSVDDSVGAFWWVPGGWHLRGEARNLDARLTCVTASVSTTQGPEKGNSIPLWGVVGTWRVVSARRGSHGEPGTAEATCLSISNSEL